MADMTAVVPPGTYYLGDPCYTVPNELWQELLESCDYFDTPEGTVYGYTVIAFGTAHGDGVYSDRAGNFYPVDAGLIGLVPVGLAGDVVRDDLVRKIQIDHPTICSSFDGVLKFGHIEINTDDTEDEDYENYQDYEPYTDEDEE
jgi:hypothetical protein